MVRVRVRRATQTRLKIMSCTFVHMLIVFSSVSVFNLVEMSCTLFEL
jgi:hypothetical protein